MSLACTEIRMCRWETGTVTITSSWSKNTHIRDGHEPHDESKSGLNSGWFEDCKLRFGMHMFAEQIFKLLSTAQSGSESNIHPENLPWKCYVMVGVVTFSSLDNTNRNSSKPGMQCYLPITKFPSHSLQWKGIIYIRVGQICVFGHRGCTTDLCCWVVGV